MSMEITSGLARLSVASACSAVSQTATKARRGSPLTSHAEMSDAGVVVSYCMAISLANWRTRAESLKYPGLKRVG